MEYESTILKRLIDTYGVVGNPRYISEIIKEFIVQGKELYPQLFTYQSDWLAHIDEFGLTPDYVVSYTGQQIYAPHTKERPVKSAILSGNTLVNLINGGEVTKNATNNWVVFSADFNADMIKTSTDYTLITYVISNTLSGGSGCDFGVSGGLNDGFSFKTIRVPSGKVGVYKIKLTTKNVFSQPPVLRQQIFNDVATGSIIFKQVLVEGDYTNVDVPYFEGMQSVKLPVLKTTGKNLFDGYLEKGIIDGNTGKPSPNESFVRSVNFIKVQSNKIYTISEKDDSTDFRVYEFDGNFNYIGELTTKTFTTSSNTSYIKFRTYPKNRGDDVSSLDFKFMLETGNTITPYEPYKSNILTVNEEVELRGIGDVKDELDVTTGKLTQRIGEIKLGNFDAISYSSTIYEGYYTAVLGIINKASSSLIMSNLVPTRNFNNSLDCGIYNNPTNIVLFKKGATLEEIKNLVSNLIVQYQLAEKSVKTVDLNILDQNGQNVNQLMSFNGGTHFTTSSQEGSLLPTIRVDVVTDLEETLKVCSLEGNTL